MSYTESWHRLSVGTVIALLASGGAISVAGAAEKCVDAGRRVNLPAQLPGWSVGELTSSMDMSEAAVINALPADQRVAVPVTAFAELWDQLRAWEDALLVVVSSGSVFEFSGALPAGTYSEGYFNLDNSGKYTAHLNAQSLAAIYLSSIGVGGHDTHQVAFFDDLGRRAFSIYVPREDDGRLKSQPHAQFLRLKDIFEPIGEETVALDLSCLSF